MSQKVFTDLKDEIVKTDSTELDVIAGAFKMKKLLEVSFYFVMVYFYALF